MQETQTPYPDVRQSVKELIFYTNRPGTRSYSNLAPEAKT